jgi:hypothetical protein
MAVQPPKLARLIQFCPRISGFSPLAVCKTIIPAAVMFYDHAI